MTDKPKGLHAKLAEVMGEAERIPKNGSYKKPGEYGHFMFVQVGDAADVIRTALAVRGVSILPSAIDIVDQNEHETKSGGTMTTMTVRTTWTLTDAETGDTARIQSLGTGGDSGDKYSPKAQTNAMKYALLMGFLLSTGDDPELSDVTDRRPRSGIGHVPVEPLVPEPDPQKDGLIGTVTTGLSPVDMEVQQTPDGNAYGFKLKNGRKAYQVLAIGPLADALSVAGLKPDERVTVWGRMDMVDWKKDGKAMPPYPRIALSKIATADWILPAEVVGPLGTASDLEHEPDAGGVPPFTAEELGLE